MLFERGAITIFIFHKGDDLLAVLRWNAIAGTWTSLIRRQLCTRTIVQWGLAFVKYQNENLKPQDASKVSYWIWSEIKRFYNTSDSKVNANGSSKLGVVEVRWQWLSGVFTLSHTRPRIWNRKMLVLNLGCDQKFYNTSDTKLVRMPTCASSLN